jgi:hypothetical protein
LFYVKHKTLFVLRKSSITLVKTQGMKALGSRSISSFLKRGITVAWYLEFLLLLTLPLVFMNDGGLTYNWPLTLSQPDADLQITAASPGITAIKLHKDCYHEGRISEQVLSFEDGTPARKLLQTLHNLAYIGVIMFITWQLKRLFESLASDQPFRRQNASRIRAIAFAVVFLVFYNVVEALLSRLYTGATISLAGAKLDWYDYSFDGETLLLGVLLLIIAEVFRRGTDYQADSESIV